MEEIETLEEDSQKEVMQIKDDCYKMAWYMRGAVNISDALMLSHEDRTIINKIINENLETTKKTGMNFF